jgi:2-succinyl-5-enolpyruvyl-6-hydroxy-3-cyclohexene-1-carboxylate synthase
MAANLAPADVAATFCATLVEEWAGLGVRAAMVAPGSRSTPMALALAAAPAIDVHIFHDERSAAFAALGYGLATGRPAIVLCSSGTAAAHFHAALIEADLSAVPIIAVTADRPPELQSVGAAQTIDQVHLFGRAVRHYFEPGVPSADNSRGWRSLARRAHWATTQTPPGPVHLNAAFREPLVGTPGPGPAPLGPADPAIDVGAAARAAIDGPALTSLIDRQRGVIVAGRGADIGPEGAAGVGALASAAGWPVLAEPRSGCRSLEAAVTTADSLLRHAQFADDHRPDVVLHLGEPWASRVLNEWLVASGALHVHVGAWSRPVDPGLVVSHWITGPPASICKMLAGSVTGASGTTWPARWAHAQRCARTAIERVLRNAGDLTEPGVAAAIVSGAAGLPNDVVVASSMPVRDVEWYSAQPPSVRVLANRGANGIDGTIATSIGVALGLGRPVSVLVGDIAFLHDSSSLTALARRDVDVRIVVIDNDGGGIFSFLPQATAIDRDRFELLYGTPHGTDLGALARAHGLPATEVTTTAELVDAAAQSGTRVIVARTDRDANVLFHQLLNAAVLEALG